MNKLPKLKLCEGCFKPMEYMRNTKKHCVTCKKINRVYDTQMYNMRKIAKEVVVV